MFDFLTVPNARSLFVKGCCLLQDLDQRGKLEKKQNQRRNFLDSKPVYLDMVKDPAANDLISWMLGHEAKNIGHWLPNLIYSYFDVYLQVSLTLYTVSPTLYTVNCSRWEQQNLILALLH